jgi:uncharacterized protein with FMN-binding domain
MKRVLLAIAGTTLGLVALLSFKTHAPPGASVGAGSAALPTPSKASSKAPGRSNAAPATTSAPPRGGQQHQTHATQVAKTYVGQAVQTPYGVVQVKVTVTGRHINSVGFAQLTAFDARSQEINSYAAHILVNETLSAQNAQIDTVSGASYTSAGYVQSLQSALDQAGIR